jgi:hypothetical protein
LAAASIAGTTIGAGGRRPEPGSPSATLTTSRDRNLRDAPANEKDLARLRAILEAALQPG